VATRLQEHERLAADTSRRTALTTAEQAAKALNVGGAAALGELVLDKSLQLEMRDTTVQGPNGTSSVKPMPYLRKAATDQWTPALDYLRQHHAAYVPAITVPVAAGNGAAPTGTPGAQGAAANGAAGAPQGTTTPTAPQAGAQGAHAAVVVFGEPAAAAHGGQAPLNAVDAIIAQNDARANAPNPLRPAQPAR
jgi:hypothetical protein